MARLYAPRHNYMVMDEHVRECWTIEFDALEEIGCVIDFNFIKKDDAEEFFENNKSDPEFIIEDYDGRPINH